MYPEEGKGIKGGGGGRTRDPRRAGRRCHEKILYARIIMRAFM